ncbi:MAG: IS110 family transposase [Pirellulaceae bacterium]|nr:IS110 family transposase [Pirellulaceae bacterium]
MDELNAHAAGIDVGATMHFVAVPEGADEVCVRSFGSFTADLEGLADWLAQCGVTTVAMESTGVYWIALYEILERRGFEVLLAEPSQIKKVPGRKSDVLDCQWIQRLHSFGLLRASFRPADAVVVLRAYLRQRETLTQGTAQQVQHMQKALEQMNVKLTEVLSDVTGQTGQRILDAILAGERDPAVLARLRDAKCKRDAATIALALQGNWREEHLFSLRQAVDLYRVYQQKIGEVDQQIEAYLASLTPPAAGDDLPPLSGNKRQKGRQEPAFDVRASLYRLLGVDLTTIHGIGPYAALQIVSEIGTDMSRWETDKHFCSWLALCPGVNKTGERAKSKSGKTRPSANRVARVLRLCGQSLLRADCALGAFARRMRVRLGAPQAITAVAHKLAKIIYGMLKYGKAYVDRGAEYYDEQYRERVVQQIQRRAEHLGLRVSEA